MKQLKLLLISGAILAFFFDLPQNTFASTILMSDNFNDGNANDGIPVDWDEDPGLSGTWSVESGKYNGSVNPGGSYMFSLAGNPSWKNYKLKVTMTSAEGVDRHILFRFTQFHVKGYSIKYRDESFGVSGLIELQKHGENVILQNNSSFKSHTGETHTFTIEANENRIKVFADNNPVPYIDYTDNTNPILDGRVGFHIEPSGIGLPTTTLYDDFSVETLDDTPSPTIGPFELPVDYTGRGLNNSLLYKSAFWEKLTASFDHTLKGGEHRPFTGTTYKNPDCPNGVVGISCYDGHNGTDFSSLGRRDVYSVGNGGNVVFASEHTPDSCTPNKGGYGCIVVAQYPDGHYVLYAHLERIYVDEGHSINTNDPVGYMGKTGCPNCGVHLHLGVLTLTASPLSPLPKAMSRNDWQELLLQVRSTSAPRYKPACSYFAPNGNKFYFQDPSSWIPSAETDPWSLNKRDGGCGIESPYLWKYEVGTAPI